jgi:hypothetical protein
MEYRVRTATKVEDEIMWTMLHGMGMRPCALCDTYDHEDEMREVIPGKVYVCTPCEQPEGEA